MTHILIFISGAFFGVGTLLLSSCIINKQPTKHTEADVEDEEQM